MAPTPEDLEAEAQRMLDMARAMREASGEAPAETAPAATEVLDPEPAEKPKRRKKGSDATDAEDENRAERDPLVAVDMTAELTNARTFLRNRGYNPTSSQAGEVWTRMMGANPGHRIILLRDPHGRIHVELRDPMGQTLGFINPLSVVDLENVMNARGM